MKRTLIAIALATTIPGCLVGNIHNNAAVAEIDSASEARSLIKRGMTQDQVLTIMGKPSNQSVFNDQTQWQFVQVQTDYSGTKVISAGLGKYIPSNTKILTVTFSTAGRVSDIDFHKQTF